MSFSHHREIFFIQKKEMAELFGFETRNKYQLLDSNREVIGRAAEENTGVLGFFARQLLGHWRTFKLHFFNNQGELALTAHHPFRFYFERLEVYDASGALQGALQKRFSILSKCFDVEDPRGRVVLEVRSPLWRLWTFRFMNTRGAQVALIEKKWGGMLKEFFLDADNFRLTIDESQLDIPETLSHTLIAAALYIDLQYFERKAKS